MMLTDHEWLRFVSFALVAGGVLGALYTGALRAMGRGLTGAMVGAVLGTAALAILTHLVMRWVLDRASAPVETDSDATDADADATPEADA